MILYGLLRLSWVEFGLELGASRDVEISMILYSEIG
jgi:hypothetical protein